MTTRTISTPMTLGQGAGLMFSRVATWNISSPITINSTIPIPVAAASGVTVNFTGTISDPTKLVKSSASLGTIVVGTTQVVATPKSTEVTGTNTTLDVTVGDKETTTLAKDSVVQNVFVMPGGLLKGLGKINSSLIVNDGATVAPGLSPGCLSSAILSLDGTYQVELAGNDPCSGYDQLQVTNTTSTMPTLQLGANSVISTVRLGTFTPKKGQAFTIISVAGTQPVQGTFKGLVEGATFTQNGIVFKISYKGGDGNDVVLTVQNTPTAPNTGFELVKANPLVTLAVATVGALTILALARKRSSARR